MGRDRNEKNVGLSTGQDPRGRRLSWLAAQVGHLTETPAGRSLGRGVRWVRGYGTVTVRAAALTRFFAAL